MSSDLAAEAYRPLTRRQMERQERAKRTRRILFMVVGLALILAAAVPALGYYQVFVRPLQQRIVGVNDRSFDLGFVVRMARRTVLQGKSTGIYDAQDTPELIIGTLHEIQADELLRQAAPRLGLTVTEQDLRERMETFFTNPLGDEAEATDRPRSERTFDERYRQRLNVLKLSSEEYRDLVRADIIRKKLEERLVQELPPGDEQVHVYLIHTQTMPQAQAVLKRLEAGEDFAKVAEEDSIHNLTKDKGGDWGWYPRGVEPDYTDIITH